VGLPAEGQGDDELGAAFVAKVRQLNAALTIPPTVEALRKEDFDRIADNAFAEAHGTYGVPRYLGRGDAHELLSRLLPAQPLVVA
jgi:alcohol dehydrogenase